MAKGRIQLPLRRNIGKTIIDLKKKGPVIQTQLSLSKGKSQSHVQAVKVSKVPSVTQNQRGRILSKGSRDLTR